jgi:curved DNA-binding protein CbpA
MESPHTVLGLAPSADAGEITRAYRKLVRRYPPELAPEQFARIHRAYQLLTSLERRMEAARTAPEEAIEQIFATPPAALKPLPPPPPPLREKDLSPLLAPLRGEPLARLFRSIFDGIAAPIEKDSEI